MATRALLVAAGLSLTACSLSDIIGTQTDPENKVGPSAVNTRAGALQLYLGIRSLETFAIRHAVRTSGLLSDELRPAVIRFGLELSVNVGGAYIDQRYMPEGRGITFGQTVYNALQQARLGAQHAREALSTFPSISSALRGRMFLTEGLMHVYLADLFCSGIPLSHFSKTSGAVFAEGSSFEEVLTRAVAFFDSAAALSEDSARFVHFASVLKARTLLNLNRFDDAARAIEMVPDTFKMAISYAGPGTLSNGFELNASTKSYTDFTLSDGEGGNGFRFVQLGDPRSDTASGVIQQTGAVPYFHYVSKKYSDPGGHDPIVIASGIEARLIQAEVALRNNDVAGMLTILNRLRTSCTSEAGCPVPAPAGIGGVAGLSPLHDPALPSPPTGKTATEARVDLLFSERALWLLLTGNRQGDLRRLVRQYGRTQDTVYPTGAYPFVMEFGSSYGGDVTIPVPDSERSLNASYRGCINREA